VRAALCCRGLQCVAVWCGIAVCCNVLQYDAVCCNGSFMMHYTISGFAVLQCVACVRCSALQWVACVRGKLLQYEAV